MKHIPTYHGWLLIGLGLLIAVIGIEVAHAGFNCYTDSLGYTHCQGTGQDSRDSYNSYRDSLGYEHYNFQNGRTMTCYTDSLGYTYCN